MMSKLVIAMFLISSGMLNLGEAFLPVAVMGKVQPLPRVNPSIKIADLQPVQRVVAMNAAAPSAVVNRAAFKSIAKLLSTCGLGVISTKAGVLDQNALGVLSKLIFNIFQPCLLFVNVASTVANVGSGTGNAAAIYLLPIAAIVQIFVGYVVGKIVSLFINGPKGGEDESAKQLLACTTFGNSGPLPLVFTESLFLRHPDTSLLGRSTAYISLYLLGWSPLFWIVGPAILADKASGKSSGGSDLLKRIFSPPVIGSLLGMVVGYVPFLRKMIIAGGGVFNPIFESMRTLGTAYLPAVLLVLSGSLLQSGSAPKPAATETPSNGAAVSQPAENENMIVKLAAVYLARFLLMPVVGFTLYRLANRLIPGSRALFEKDPLLLLVLLLETCMPSAQNTTVILQLQGAKSAAARLARTLMIIYVLGVPAISFWLVKILELTGLAA